MIFPVYDISEYSWNRFRIKEHNILFENPFKAILPENNAVYLSEIRKFKYIDRNGIIFQVNSFKICKRKRWLIGFVKTGKIEYEFEQTEERIPFDKFKILISNRAIETNNSELLTLIKSCNSFESFFDSL